MTHPASRVWLLAVVVAALVPPAAAFAGVDRSIESRWRGAWVVTRVAVQSDCTGVHTDNAVSGTLINSRGRFGFRAGEIARIDKVDVHRSRIDLILSLPEPILLSTQDGPFTLYNEARCPLELDIDVPKDRIAHDDLNAVEAVLLQVVDRFDTTEEAQRSSRWNHRKRDPYPADYDRTLADHQAWKAQQANAGIKARIDRALEETSRLTDRVTSDRDYLAGFAAGIEKLKGTDLGGCRELMALDFSSFAATPPLPPTMTGSDARQRWARGYQDGQKLVFGLESIRGLPACFVPAPQEETAVRRQPLH
jgi:hypothetical protein